MLSFRNRLLILIIGLVVSAETVTLFTALARTSSAVRERADAQLVAGAHVASRLLEYRERLHANAVAVLAADYGLRAAVGNGDKPTVASALANHAARIGADLTLALDLDGKVIARGEGAAADPALVAALEASAERADGKAHFVVAPNGVYQVFMAPVLAPDEIARVVLGFSVDVRLAQELRDLVGVDVVFLTGAEGTQHARAGTVPALLNPRITVREPLRASPTVVALGDVDYLATVVHLSTASPSLDIALFKPMDEVMAPYRQLALNLGLIIGVTIAAAVIAGIYLGRSAARPVQQLAEGALRIAAGDYSQGVAGSGGRELANLAQAFNSMQSGIADRESRLMHMARHDTATGLPNRLYAEEWISQQQLALPRARIGIVRIAVTNLQEISAGLGFEIAEQLVWHLARCLEHWSENGGLVARIDSSHFLVAVCPMQDDDLVALATQVRERSQSPLATAGITLQAAVVLGAAVAPRHGSNATELLRCVEAAVETAVSQKQSYALFERASDEAQRRRLQVGADLPQALQAGQLYLHYQPKFRMADRSVTGFEALVRWKHPEFGTISPAEFVPIAERTGASGALTHWVLHTALLQLSTWQRQGLHIDMAVNLSAADILDPGMLKFILEALRATQIAPGSLTLEITESVLLHEPDIARRNIELLRIAGVRFSIDDFGTGYSSLSQLRELAADELKIDQSFVRHMADGSEHAAVIRAIIELAHGLGLRTVAEGVEQEAQWRLLAEMGCDCAQGYLTGKPQAADDLAPLLESARRSDAAAETQTSSLRVLELRRVSDS